MRNDELAHHGIRGQKWGVRRFQNEDGSLTAAGRDRYGVLSENPDHPKPKSPIPSNPMDGDGWAAQSKMPKDARSASGTVSSSARKTGKQKVNEFVHSKTGKKVIVGAVAVTYGAQCVSALIYANQRRNGQWRA